MKARVKTLKTPFSVDNVLMSQIFLKSIHLDQNKIIASKSQWTKIAEKTHFTLWTKKEDPLNFVNSNHTLR